MYKMIFAMQCNKQNLNLGGYSIVQIYTSIILFVVINILFYFKYMSRISPLVGVLSVMCYLVFMYFTFRFYKKRKNLFSSVFRIILLAVFAIGSIVTLFYIHKESLNVDRWEMIEIFWDSASKGIYPYGVHSPSGNYPGPMPFYFIFCYPFYLIGEIGLMPIVGIFIWLFHIYKKKRNSVDLTILLLLSSLAMYWEIFARSTVFFNSCLFVIWFTTLYNLDKKSTYSFYLSAIVGGLLFSTRNVFAIPLLIMGIYMLRCGMSFGRLLKWSGCFIVAFILTFIPFVVLDWTEFFVMNPFIIQSSFLLPLKFVLCFLGASVIIPFLCKQFKDVIFYSGVFLFVLITGYIIYCISVDGLQGYFYTGADISYYIFCFPFLLEVIVNKQMP